MSKQFKSTRVITARHIREDLHVSNMSLWRMIKDGRLPKPRYIGKRRRWIIEEYQSAVAKLLSVASVNSDEA
jgi:predicted DNA-binding transcriptional regulator AlpA